MPFSKMAHEASLSKVAAADHLEIPDAIRLGFNHGVLSLGLSPDEARQLGKLAAVALQVHAPTAGLAKIAADFTGADTDPADPATRRTPARDRRRARRRRPGGARAVPP